MHATYAFLIDIDDPQADILEITECARTTFDTYANRYCDENNWTQDMALVLDNGRFIPLFDRQDYWMSLELTPKPKVRAVGMGAPLRAAVRRGRLPAWRHAVVLPLRRRAGVRTGVHERLRSRCARRILSEIPPRLSALWGKGALLPSRTEKDDTFLDRYQRAKWSRQFTLFLHSQDIRDHAPFTTDTCSPYEYRAFDLTDDSKAPKAILFMDIHT